MARSCCGWTVLCRASTRMMPSSSWTATMCLSEAGPNASCKSIYSWQPVRDKFGLFAVRKSVLTPTYDMSGKLRSDGMLAEGCTWPLSCKHARADVCWFRRERSIYSSAYNQPQHQGSKSNALRAKDVWLDLQNCTPSAGFSDPLFNAKPRLATCHCCQEFVCKHTEVCACREKKRGGLGR